jgi:hypothetical protein
MNIIKQHAKLLKLMVKADECLSRKQAQKLIRKADKVQARLDK